MVKKGNFAQLSTPLPPNCEKQFASRSKNAGFHSEQAFLIAACERELRQRDSKEAITQFEARVAATLTNLAKQGDVGR